MTVARSTAITIILAYQTRVTTWKQHESTSGSRFDMSSFDSAEERPRPADQTNINL